MRDPVDDFNELVEQLREMGLEDKAHKIIEEYQFIWQKAAKLPGVSLETPTYEQTKQCIFLREEVDKLKSRYKGE